MKTIRIAQKQQAQFNELIKDLTQQGKKKKKLKKKLKTLKRNYSLTLILT